MDAAMLKTFPRKKIQDLAKKYGVKANLKTDSIIALLMNKHPNGVPSGQSQSARKGQTNLKTFQRRRSTRLSASARPQAPQPAAHPVAIPEHERSSASIVYDEVRSTVSSNSSPEHDRSSPLPILDEDSNVGPLRPLVERRDGPSTTTSGTQSDHHREEPISPEVPHDTPGDYTTQVDEFLDSIAAAQSVAGPSRLPAVQYTPNGRPMRHLGTLIVQMGGTTRESARATWMKKTT
ncbi:hypothetical protein PHLGIDRAFT_138702 [Phlebiopsis gigantea 11061_1 CR5-6]|uniref:Uncharacterized protein n=1 Tax=Phlebiopsis gigantea (strain 11061_1 CR5-6) TaxID=745531 RepID=A0A0C3PXM3_PHLG1|nr:hypothetical protein PHLGIDRAFT_138702 [Phlebiopsis gigantea 11061_1 CR5-6]